jgi:uncharacterized protein (TIRG00374 family)
MGLHGRVRRKWVTVVKVSVSVGLLLYVVWSIAERDGFEVLVARLSDLTLPFVGLAIVLHFAAVLAGIQRYRLLLERRGLDLPFTWLTKTYLVGRFVGAFTPSTMGLDLYRSIAVARRTNQKAESAAAVLAEKLFGLSGLSIVTLVLVAFGAGDLLGASALPMALFILVTAGIGLYALGRPEKMKRLTSVMPGKLATRVAAVLEAITKGERTASGTAQILALSIVSHLATASVFVATALALDLSVDTSTLLVVGNAIVIATLLPISVGGVGVREGVAIVLLAAASVGPTDASLVALLGYVTGQMPALVGGLLNLTGDSRETSMSPAVVA